jgi:hypothetical protein
MFRSIIIVLVLVFSAPNLQAQFTSDANAERLATMQDDQAKEMAIPTRDAFHLGVLKAIKERRKKGEMTATQALRLRVAMISPAFRKKAEDLAVTQMAFSGVEEGFERGDDGKIDRASIDWEGLTMFLEKLLPFLLQLLEILATAQHGAAAIVA